MRLRLQLILALALALLAGPALAQESVDLLGVDNSAPAAAVVTYVGPADAFGLTLKYGYSWRAVSTAAAAAQVNAVRLGHTADVEKCNVKVTTTGHPATVVTGCSGIGSPTADGTLLTTWCAMTAGSCFGDTWYEQNGTGADAPVSGTAPTVVFSCVGSDPCFQGGGAGGFLASSATLTTQAGGLSISAIAKRTSGTTQSDILSGSTGVFFAATGRVGGYFGSAPDVAATPENTWYLIQWRISGTTSAMNVSGTDTASGLDFGTGDLSAGFYLFRQNTGSYLTGQMFEALVFTGGPSNSTQRNALCNNQKTFTGISATC